MFCCQLELAFESLDASYAILAHVTFACALPLLLSVRLYLTGLNKLSRMLAELNLSTSDGRFYHRSNEKE